MTNLIALAERVEGLTGPDRNTDIDVAAALGRVEPAMASYGPYLRRMYGRDCAPLTASLDAVCALIAEKLPGWAWNAGSTHAAFLSEAERPFSADIMGNVREVQPGWGEPPELTYDNCSGNAATPALALLAAALRALSKDTER